MNECNVAEAGGKKRKRGRKKERKNECERVRAEDLSQLDWIE